MWTTKTIQKTTTSKEIIWNIWADVSNWNIWDNDVEKSEINGEFKLGTKGFLKAKKGPKSNFEITEYTNQKSFTTTSNLPLCKMHFVHTLTETSTGIEIMHKIEMVGFTSFLFSKLIGKNFEKSLPEAVSNLIKLAENK